MPPSTTSPMNDRPVLVAGLGSPHGDDQAGWLVIDELAGFCHKRVALRKLWSPHELLNHFAGESQVHLCDAADLAQKAGSVLQLDWPDWQPVYPQPVSSHGPALEAVIPLLQQLHSGLEITVRLWAISGQSWEELSEPCTEVRRAARQVAHAIAAELSLRMSAGPGVSQN